MTNEERRKGHVFLEIFASALHEDYRFPILEIFAFLYAIGTFALMGLGGAFPVTSGEAATYRLVTFQMNLPLFIFLILVFKNVVYGFGSDIEKGIIQTLLSYPLKRHMMLTAKLLSALGIALALFLGIQIFSLYMMAPQMISEYFTTVAVTYLATLSYPLFLSGLLLLITMKIRKGGLALVVGIILYFAVQVISGILVFLAYALDNPVPLQAISAISPALALQAHYSPEMMGRFTGKSLWNPSFNEVLAYIGAGYALVVFIFAVAYLYYCRRFSI